MTAAERILQKALVASSIDSGQWNGIQAALRDRAFFSAQVASVQFLHAAREMIAARSTGDISESEIRRDLRRLLKEEGYDPREHAGTIKDLRTRTRLDLIIQTNTQQARGYVQHLEATNRGALAAFPAYELVRAERREKPRAWRERWRAAGGRFYDAGRMIALKTDPVWAKISRFGNPFPPFDFNSGMGVEDVSYGDCLRLGVVKAGDPPQSPPEIRMNASLQAEVPCRDDSPEADWLRDKFADQIDFRHNIAKWRGNLIADVLDGREKKAEIGSGYDGRKLSISHNFFKAHLEKHVGENETHGANIPLNRGDYDLLPSIWRNPDRVLPGHGKDEGRVLLEFDAIDGSTFRLVVDKDTGITSFYRTKNPGGA